MKMLLLLVLCLTLTVPAFADDMMDEIVSARDGKKALLFSFNGMNLSSFDGGIGAKWWMSGSTALLGTVLLGNRGYENKATEERWGNESTDLAVGLSLGIEKHMTHFGRFSPYIGGSIGYVYGYRLTESIPPTGSDRQRDTRKRESNSLSVGVLFGVECFLTKNLSVGGQYELAGAYTSGQEEAFGEVRDYNEHRLGIGSSQVALAIYF